MTDLAVLARQLERAIPREPAHLAGHARNVLSTLRIYTNERSAADDRENARRGIIANIDRYGREKARAATQAAASGDLQTSLNT